MLGAYLMAKELSEPGMAKAQERLLERSGLMEMPETLARLERAINKQRTKNAAQVAAPNNKKRFRCG